MRKTAVALALVLVATLGILVPSVAAASGDPKVVIIVGATHGATAGYRADADRAYAEAIKYTSNVVKVYSPNATWAKVKAAVAGASIVIYMGHGNGWPSPYTYDAKYTTKDGFGLNATAGAGDSNNKYYGEPSIATLQMAPGAIVLLHHLCYASGNSEPGNPEPTVSVARQRADNYASAFLKAGASAVIADGHSGPEGYLRALFTTHQSVEDMWRNASNGNGNIVSFPSSRTPGATVYQDPNTPTSGFYRALTVKTIGVTTDEVISAGYGDTSADPGHLIVPGNASVTTDGAALYADADTTTGPASTLPAGTRLRAVEEPVQTTDVSAPQLVEVQGIDDPSITGFVLASDIAGRDSTAPVVRVLDPGGPFSPNDDGQGDQTTLQGRFTESVDWTLKVSDDHDHVLFTKTGTGATFQVPWDGIVSGHPVGDGTYDVSVTGVDAWENAPAHATRSLTVDTQAPDLESLTPDGQWFSPNGDGVRDTASLTATNSDEGSLVVRVLDSGDSLVKQWTVANGTAPAGLSWNGKNTAGAVAPDGVYTVSVAPRDLAGNTGDATERSVTLIAGLRSVATSTSIFYPQDNDSLARTARFSFALSRPMTVTWTVRNAAGVDVVTHTSAAALPAGAYAWTFDGRRSDGSFLPRGHYNVAVLATDGTLTAFQGTGFDLTPFRVTASDTTPARGQKITITVVSAETLKKAPMVTIKQPGSTWKVRMTKTSANHYKLTFTLKKTGGTGTVSYNVWAKDKLGHAQSVTPTFVLH